MQEGRRRYESEVYHPKVKAWFPIKPMTRLHMGLRSTGKGAYLCMVLIAICGDFDKKLRCASVVVKLYALSISALETDTRVC